MHDLIRVHGARVNNLKDVSVELPKRLVVEHTPETISIGDLVVDLGPGAGSARGEVVFEGTVEGLRASGTITGRHFRGPGGS